MLRFRWENIWTQVYGDEADIRYLQSLLAFPNKRTGVTASMYDDRRNRLLSGLVDRMLILLKRAGVEFEVVGRPERESISTIEINPDLLDGATLREFQTQSLRKAIWAQRGILKLPTGCLAGDSVVRVNRGGRDYSISLSRAFAFQNPNDMGQPIKTMVRSFLGDRVGFHSTGGIVYSGQHETFELVLENGRVIRATADHEILTEEGYVSLGGLASSHKVMCNLADDFVETSKVKYIRLYGVEDTYDIVCEEPYRNFVANGIIVHNSGKTIVSAALAKYLDDKKDVASLMIVPGVNSLNQSWARWQSYGLRDVGRLGDGHQDFNSRHLIAVVNSAYSIFNDGKPEALEWAKNLGCIMWMEAHHAQSMIWSEIGKMANVSYRFGLTATPFVNGGEAETVEDYTILGISGEIVSNVSDSLLMNLGIMAVPKIHFLRMGSKARFTDTNWHSVKKAGIVANDPRNTDIVSIASRCAEAGRKVIVLINEIEHCKIIARGVSKEIGSSLVFHGGSKLLKFSRGLEKKSDKTEIQKLNQYLDEMDSYVLIGSPAIDEDADFPSADTLIVGAGGRSPRRVIQRAGRVLRPKKGENCVDIVDFEDFSNVVLRSHSKSRLKTYAERYVGAKGFEITNHTSSDDVIASILNISVAGGDDGIKKISIR